MKDRMRIDTMWSRIFMKVGVFIVLCGLPSRAQIQFEDSKNFESDVEWRTEDGFDGNKPGCLRYCVRKMISDISMDSQSTKRIRLIWNIGGEAKVMLTEGASNSWDGNVDLRWESTIMSPETSLNLREQDLNCLLYLELGCETEVHLDVPSIPNESANLYEKKLVSVDHAIGLSSSPFIVDEMTEKLSVTALGNLSQAILEIPVAPHENSMETKTTMRTVSLLRTREGKRLKMIARNPQPGGWRLNLSGTKNCNYDFRVTAFSAGKSSLDSNDTAKGDKMLGKSSEMSSRLEQFIPETRNYDDQDVEMSKSAADASLGFEPQVPTESQANLDKIDEVEDVRARNKDDSELEELSRVTDEFSLRTRRTVVDVHPNTELIAQAGTYHNVAFTVTNNQATGKRYSFQGESKPFPYVGVSDTAFWLAAGATGVVTVRILVPPAQDPLPSITTLNVRGIDDFEVETKSAFIYVQGSTATSALESSAALEIDYYFNDNCAGKLHRDRCAKSHWSVEIIARDQKSGLKLLTSQPYGLVPREPFIAGTKENVNFLYTATCCHTTVQITATDVLNKQLTKTIDVTAWDNLSDGEIAAIVVGALFILLLIIVLIILIVYCVRSRKSQDLSYSQRYGSRSPHNADRSNL